MPTRTSPYEFLVGVSDDADDVLPAADWILVAQTLNDALAALADLCGSGVWSASDFEVTSAGGLEVTVAGGRAFVGGAGARKFVLVSGSETFTGLTDGTTYGIYVGADGARSAVKAGDSAPAGALLVRTFATTEGAVTNIAIPATLVILSERFRARDLVTLEPVEIAIPDYDRTYRVEFDFSDAGVFSDPCYVVTAVADGSGVIVDEDIAQKTTGKFALLILVQSGAPYGAYGSALDVQFFSIQLAGVGWTGASLGPAAVSVSSPVEV